MQDYEHMLDDKIVRENGYNKETTDSIYFFTPRFYALDNFSAYSVELWGRKFSTSEHAYQWKKYHMLGKLWMKLRDELHTNSQEQTANN